MKISFDVAEEGVVEVGREICVRDVGKGLPKFVGIGEVRGVLVGESSLKGGDRLRDLSYDF